MQEYECKNCGYRKMEKNMTDMITQIPFYSGFIGGFIPGLVNDVMWQEEIVCPNCGKASTWQPLRNNNN